MADIVRAGVSVAVVVVMIQAATVFCGFPAKLTLERAFPTNHGVEIAHLRGRDRARHGRMLQSSGGVIDFPVAGTYDPFLVGLYYTKVQLGNPPKDFYVQIDTGSDVLWVSCNSCNGCPATSGLQIQLNFFDPGSSSTATLVSCSDQICALGVQSSDSACLGQSNQCAYVFQYGDGSGTSGYYVMDMIHLDVVVGGSVTSNSSASVVFGCSTSLTGDLTKSDRAVDGIFGFGQQDLSVISQLSSRGVAPKVFSHCLKGDDSGGGILVLASDSELNCLLEFKKGIQKDPHNLVNGKWDLALVSNSHGCPSSWTGVSCDENGNVSAIVLDRLGLGGELKFQTLIGLKSLKNLSLSGNDFTGRLVPTLGTLSSLQHLDLSSNRFYGPIPERINDLYNLNYLNFSVNDFNGGFPVGRLNLNQLKVLDLHSNRLYGNIGLLVSQLRNVEYVDLSHNEFYGGLSIGSDNVSSLANTLKSFNLSYNRLNGGFFDVDSLMLFRNLVVLDMGHNQIIGELPSFGSLPNLRILRLGNNLLSGLVPGELLNRSLQLEELDLSGNAFTGSILRIDSSTLKFLDLSSNALSGDISILQSWEANFEVLDLSSNKFSGSFPNITSFFQGLKVLNVRNNFIEGPLPFTLGNYPSMSAVDFSLNGFSGTIPASFFTSVTLISLNLSGNRLTGPIPLQGSSVSELLVKPSDLPLEYLDLSNNSLSGGLPSEIDKLARLKLLNLAKNELSGPLPDQLNRLSNLEYLDLSNNKFTGEIPDMLPNLHVFNVSYNDLSGDVPENLRNFPISSFRPGNDKLNLPKDIGSENSIPNNFPEQGRRRTSKANIQIAIILASVGAVVMIVFLLLAYHRAQRKEFHGRSIFSGQGTERNIKIERFRPSIFKFQPNNQPPPTSSSFSNDHLLTSTSRTLSGQAEFSSEISEHVLPGGGAASSSIVIPNLLDDPVTSGKNSSPGSPLSSSHKFVEGREQPVTLDVYSPDRLAGELFFLDNSLLFTAEELSRAPAEVLGRSSHGTLYKATLDSGHMLAVKWLRVGLVKHKKEFAKEVKRIGSMRHKSVVPLRAYYWGPREQERLLLADYILGDSLALHLYETTPRRYSRLSFSQRLKIAVEVARCLLYLHDRGLPHGNLKPTNIILAGHDSDARLTDYGLHRLMTPAGIAEQILNLGALGYCAPELASAAKPGPSFKADIYSFGVILMELLTKRSAGDIISGQSGAVDLTDWVRLCDQEGRRMDCIDRDIVVGEEPSKAMDELLAVSLKCIRPVNERPNIRQVFDDLCAISV